MLWEAASEARILFLFAVIFTRDQWIIRRRRADRSSQRAAVWVSRQRRVGQAEDNGRHLTCSHLRRAQLFCTSCDLRTGRWAQPGALRGLACWLLLPCAASTAAVSATLQRRWRTDCPRAGRGWGELRLRFCLLTLLRTSTTAERNGDFRGLVSARWRESELRQRNFPTSFPWQLNDCTD